MLPFDAIPLVEVPESDRKNPVAYLMRAAVECGPIFRRRTTRRLQSRYGPWQVYLIGPAANRFVLHTHRHLFSHERGWHAFFGGVWDENLLYLDHATHATHRQVLQPAFTQAAMASYLPALHRVIASQTSGWGAPAQIETRGALRAIAFHAVAEALLGLGPPEAVAQLHAQRDRLCRNPAPFGKRAYWDHIQTERANLNAYVRELLTTRVDTQAHDVIARMRVALHAEPPLMTDTQFMGHLQILLEAGHTTTMDVATWLLGFLATHPQVQERIRTEVDATWATQGSLATAEALRGLPLLSRAIDEAGRLRSPVDTATRGTLAEIEFAGYQIPTGNFVRLHLGASHRLPDVFAEPDRFDPDRFAPPREEEKRTPYGLVTFGGGPRICLGVTFAQTELRALTAHLLRHYRLEPVADETPANVYDPGEYDDSLPRGLPLRFIPRPALDE